MRKNKQFAQTLRPKGRLGRTIRTIRIGYGMSLDQLAKDSRISKGSLSRIENGGDNVSVDSLMLIAHALHMDGWDLLKASDQNSFTWEGNPS